TADRLTSMQCDLIERASTDGLTKLLNRRAFFERASEACEAAGTKDPLSAIMFDVDHFKRVNDTYGHEVGDAVLAAVRAIAKTAAATVARLGGEEFCLLKHCNLNESIELAERLRFSVSRLRFPQQCDLEITCSFGVAEWKTGDTIDLLLRRAD